MGLFIQFSIVTFLGLSVCLSSVVITRVECSRDESGWFMLRSCVLCCIVTVRKEMLNALCDSAERLPCPFIEEFSLLKAEVAV